jgi:hypothetical protein
MPNGYRSYLFVISSKDCIKRVGSSDQFAQSACAAVVVAVLTNTTEVGTQATAVWPCLLQSRQVAEIGQLPGPCCIAYEGTFKPRHRASVRLRAI